MMNNMSTKEKILKMAVELYNNYIQNNVENFEDFWGTLDFLRFDIEDEIDSTKNEVLANALNDARDFCGYPFMQDSAYKDFEDMLCYDGVAPRIILDIISLIGSRMIEDLFYKKMSSKAIKALLDALEDEKINIFLETFALQNKEEIKAYCSNRKLKV